ncbi:hypothetical protein PR003_g8041 [Phytophthora rubi]|uniref:tRNA (guanine(9)-N(1))-methyltransferase n=1 Tax=Phytophthora rubi TaxID=129364 RepID=A0A6A3MQ07_9STRA|nr:hypothetical protein PR002_g7798 [Phytophthora rubi]KAE9035173.1 hypothetical protein PR001_g9422 [Phytophthora rubi]KAE9345248.1 hypothetical protein PR003_g8041 [Phytophthora rubi]
MRPSAAAVGLVAFATCCVLGFYGYRYCQHAETFKECAKTSKQCRREMWRSKRRARKDQLLQAKKLARSQALAAERTEMTEEQKNELRERIRMQRVEQYQKLEDAQLRGVRVVVDLAFAVDQTTRERNSILKQLGCVYGYLKSCPLDNLVSLHLASYTQDLAAVCAQHGALSWKIERHEEPLEKLYDAEEIVYLSPDSDNVLETIDPACVYVVGGIVDRSVRKGQTISKAAERGVQTARLPLQEHFAGPGARVRTHIMNIDSVIIALNEVANHGDWGRAFERAVPVRIACRKGA